MNRDGERIALFGGTFDPPHLGHLSIAREAVVRCGLDRVIFIPCRRSPHKTNETSATPDQRCEMLELCTAGETWAETSRVELDRESPSYSWESAEHFAALHPGATLHWILGQDQWATIESWSHPERLRDLVTFIVFPRNAIAPVEIPGFRFQQIDYTHPASASQIRELLRDGKAPPDLLQPSVADYIGEHRLYRTAPASS